MTFSDKWLAVIKATLIKHEPVVVCPECENKTLSVTICRTSKDWEPANPSPKDWESFFYICDKCGVEVELMKTVEDPED